MNIFSHPAFYTSGKSTLVGYNLFVSRATATGPSYFGPWTPVAAYQGYTSNFDIVDVSGGPNDLYRVQPIVAYTLPDGTAGTGTLNMSRPFFSWTPLYDAMVSQFIDTFRNSWLSDSGIKETESTIVTENSGASLMPFVSDPDTTRYFLSFLPNDDPVKIVGDSVKVWHGATKAAAQILTPYSDYAPSEDGGFIDFAESPAANDYVRVEYTKVRYTNDQIRSMILNAVSSLSLYGINSFQVNQSNNLYYLGSPIPNRDLGDIMCQIAYRNRLNAAFQDSLEGSESWKDGKVEWMSDPGRALQAAAARATDIEAEIRRRCNIYIYNTRNYISRGEFESFFDVSGVLPVYTLIVAGANIGGAIGWWL